MGEPSYDYNSMSWASSSEKSDIELSDEESPAASSCSFSASSVAYFWMYSGKGSTSARSKTANFGVDCKFIYPQIDLIFLCGFTFNFLLVHFWPVKVHGSCVSI